MDKKVSNIEVLYRERDAATRHAQTYGLNRTLNRRIEVLDARIVAMTIEEAEKEHPEGVTQNA